MTRTSKDELRTRLLAIFQEEAAGHLHSIAKEMAELERTDDDDALKAVDGLFRTVHTLKGAARSLSIRGIEQLCHEIEDYCSALVQRQAPLDGPAREVLASLTQKLETVTTRTLAQPTPAATPKVEPPEAPTQMRAPQAPDPLPPAAPRTVGADRTSALIGEASVPAQPKAPLERPAPSIAPSFVRIDSEQIQRLGMMAEDLLTPKLTSQARIEEARRLMAGLSGARRERQSAAGGRPNEAERAFAQELRQTEQVARQLVSGLAEDSRVLRGVVDALILELRHARMMPASEMLAVFPSMVADLAREVGKTIRWRTSGTDLLIDRQIAEVIKDPLIHMVRNAVDHGIEPPQARAAAGKPTEGTLSLVIEPAEGGRVAFEISDDGMGIDVAAVREAAVRARIISREEATEMPEADAIDLIFQSNLSTRGVISAMSGRGLGLSIVRERAERLGGSVHLVSMPATGTVLRLEVPAALANFRGIAARVGGTTYICPRDAVERTLAISADDAETARARGTLPLDGDLLPFGHLNRLLGQEADEPPASPTGLRSCLVLRQGARRGVLAVDEVDGDCEVVVKELPPPLLRVRHVLAAGLLGTGQLALILRTADVLDTLATRPRRAGANAQPVRRAGRHRLLVVDDSLTTRAMEVGLLEAAGYEVEAAADGLEAWARLQSAHFDAVVSDVDMPNMDGFELTAKIRADARVKELPIVLVTALEKREDHDRSLRLGANAYMMKSDFDQSMLIDLVRRVL